MKKFVLSRIQSQALHWGKPFQMFQQVVFDIICFFFKEPAPQQAKQKQKPKPPKPKVQTRTQVEQSQSGEKYGSKIFFVFYRKKKNAFWLIIVERKSIRKSTAAKSAATALRVKVRNLEQKKKVKKPKEEEWVPTQEELLEEAKITEQENLASLGEYVISCNVF